jgi:iron complex outermembrane receptor protein
MIYGINGTTNYEGIETTLRYRFSDEWSLRSAAQFTQAIQHSTDPTINGKLAENTPRFGGNVSLTYRPPYVEGLAITAGTNYIGKRELNPQDQGLLPSVNLYNIGASYKTILYDHPTSFNLGVSNLLDTKYWSSAVNNTIGVGTPRTIRFGMKVEF